MKRILSTLMIFAAAIIQMQAQRFQSGELWYNITDAEAKTVEVTYEKSFYTGQNYQNISPTVVIPETVVYNDESYSVKSISAEAFKICKPLEEITIPKSIDSIGQQALDACHALKAIHVAEGNANYCSEDGVLFNTDKTTLILFPPSKTGTSYTVPESVTEIKTSAFSYCGLSEIIIPDGVTSIGFGAFYRCKQLEKINLPQGLTCIEYDLFNGCSRLAEVSIPDGVTVIEHGVFYDCYSLSEIILPQQLDSIGENAFSNCNIREITLPQGMTTIGPYAFANCNIREITLPQGLTTIGTSAFANCTYLSKITLPLGLDSIGESAFYNCGTAEISIPKQVRSIGNGAFSSCSKLKAIHVTEGNPHYCSENGILFNSDKTELIQYPAGAEACEYTLPESVHTIRQSGFEECRLQKITVPGTIQTINYSAFCYCEALTELTFWSLTPPQLSYNAFHSHNPELSIYVSGDALKSYQNAEYWKDLNIQTINFESNQINYILANFKQNTVRVTSNKTDGVNYGSLPAKITIPSEVTRDGATYRVVSISDDAFYGCPTLQELTMADGIETIGKNAFYGCTTLKNISFSNTVQTIDERSFYGCTALEELTIPENISEIGREAFMNCTALKKADILNGVETIGENAFCACTSLTEITLPGTLTTWGDYAFIGCTALQSLTLDEGITSVGQGAFADCMALTQIDFPGTLSRIESNAFAGCDAIKKMTVKATTPPIIMRRAFNAPSQETTVYVPASALEAYRQADTWKEFNLQPIDTGTAIETITTADGLRIEAGRLLNPQAIRIEIVDLQGRTVYTGSDASITLPEGIYVVRSKGVSRKVMITK